MSELPPTNRNRPMWDTSNSPAELRVARCSSCIDEYQIGNSYPWKSIIFAPSEVCDWYREVRTGAPLMYDCGEGRWKNNADIQCEK